MLLFAWLYVNVIGLFEFGVIIIEVSMSRWVVESEWEFVVDKRHFIIPFYGACAFYVQAHKTIFLAIQNALLKLGDDKALDCLLHAQQFRRPGAFPIYNP